jgi:dTDP-4-amino-4,6-dideoxygalactose transaminase
LYKGKSVFRFGDICTTSFHATKLFHTVEGGAVFTNDDELLRKMALLRNFGHNGPTEFLEVGINGKNSEVHAAMGLANLKYVNEILNTRRNQSLQYDKWLDRAHTQRIEIHKDSEYNYAYYPLILKDEETTLRVIRNLEANRISPRRYFYPSLNTVPLYAGSELPVSEAISKRIICLPLYHTLSTEEINFISRIILRASKYGS